MTGPLYGLATTSILSTRTKVIPACNSMIFENDRLNLAFDGYATNMHCSNGTFGRASQEHLDVSKTLATSTCIVFHSDLPNMPLTQDAPATQSEPSS